MIGYITKSFLTRCFRFFGSQIFIVLFIFVGIIPGYRSLSKRIHLVVSNVASSSVIRLAAPGTPGLSVRCIADNHVAVNEDEWLLSELEGFQSEAEGTFWGWQ